MLVSSNPPSRVSAHSLSRFPARYNVHSQKSSCRCARWRKRIASPGLVPRSNFRNAQGLADHEAAGTHEEQRQRMKLPGTKPPGSPIETLPDAVLPAGDGKHGSQENGGGNRRAFEVGHLVATFRQAFGGDVVACKPAHAAADEIDQRQPVPGSSQAGGETERRPRDAERDDVGKRIQFPPERRMGMSEAGHPAVEPVEDKRGGRQRRSDEIMSG